MRPGYPAPEQHTPGRTTVSDVPVRSRSAARRPLVGRVLTGLLTGRLVAGPRIEDAVRVAAELVADGRLVALEHVPAAGEDVAAELSVLVAEVHAAGLAAACELTVPRGLDREGQRRVGAAAGTAGVALAVPDGVDGIGATVVVSSGDRGAESRCRALADRRVRLLQGHGAVADRAFVRCLTVLMAGSGRPAVAASDPRLIAIAGERAAWNGRDPDSWEHVMPYGILTDEQHRLVAGGYGVRVAVPSGPGAVALLARRFGGRS
jgi:proline dehydrogenase